MGLVLIEEFSQFRDKRGREYTVNLLESGFALTYTSSKTGFFKTVPFTKVSKKDIESAFHHFVKNDMWKVLYTSYHMGEPKWLVFDGTTNSFNSNIDRINQYLSNPITDNQFYIYLFKIFRDSTLVQNVKYLIDSNSS
jgi:hypothetical protein